MRSRGPGRTNASTMSAMTNRYRTRTRALVKITLCVLMTALGARTETKATNVILFLADGASLATVSGARIYGHGRPLALYVQNMPHTGLSETSTASQWVSDSAAA